MCLDGRGKVEGINSCLRKEIQGELVEGGCRVSSSPQTQAPALQAQGSGSPLGSLDPTEDPKPEQRKHNPAAYRGQVL